MAYTTLATVRQYLGISATTDDALIASLIVTAQAIIEAPAPLGTGRAFEVTTNTSKTFDVPGGRLLRLAPHEAASIASVTNGDGVVVDTAYYTTEPRDVAPYRAIILKAGAPVYWTYTDYREGAITISAKWGYSTTPSGTVQHLAARLAAWLYRQRDGSGDAAVQTDVGIILPSRLPADLQMMLRTLRPML